MLSKVVFGDASPDERRSTLLLWLLWAIWVPGMIPGILNFFGQRPAAFQVIASLSAAVLFFAIYLIASLREARLLVTLRPAKLPESSLRIWLPLAALIVIGWLLAGSDVQVWGQLFIYMAAYAGGRLPTLRGVWGVTVVFLVTTFGILRSEPSWSNFFGGAVFVAIVGGACIIMARSRLIAHDLRTARDEIARLAVAAERLRFARDLHDLLGHSLSLIALKTELARQLIEVNPARAALELDDIERAARESLREVREAVSGYRQPTLASELHEAENMLAAAGIAYRSNLDDRLLGSLSPTAEAVLSWTVREGITNVMRHSRARHCRMRLLRAGDDACIEISDDGSARLSATGRLARAGAANLGSDGDGNGNGLRGLAERVDALGGRFEAGPGAGGGFRLAVAVPAQHGGSESRGVLKGRALHATSEAVETPAGSPGEIEEARETA